MEIYKDRFSNTSSKKNISIFFGVTAAMFEALEKGIDIIQICSDPVFDSYNEKIWTNLRVQRQSEYTFRYSLILPGKYIFVGNKNKKNKIETKIVADSIEALIGAIYLDQGFDFAQEFVLKLWKKHIDKSNITVLDSKTKLQEYSLKIYKKLPIYRLINSSGPRHKPTFKISVSILGSKLYTGTGSSKQDAQQNAAKKLLKNITII